MPSADMEMQKNDIIQIAPPHKWAGCLAIVSEMKSFGVQAYVSIPSNDGKPPGRAYIRLKYDDFEMIGAPAVFVPPDEDDDDCDGSVSNGHRGSEA